MSCEQCVQGNLMSGEPEGAMVDGAYFHEGPNKDYAVVLLTDVFGLPLVNNKLLTDRFSKELQCDVWAPHIFNGEPIFRAEDLEPIMPRKVGDKLGFWSILRLIGMFIPRIHRFWANRAAAVDPIVDSFIAKVRDQKKYRKVGVVGYCFGGSAGIRLGSRGLVDSLVICHPGNCPISEISAINIPTSWVCAQVDMTFSDSLREQAEKVFAARKDKPGYIDYEFTVYAGTQHGFAARPDLSLPEIVKAHEEAFIQSKNWFEKTLA